jgi:transcriptional regulator with XRE-family HTH domain
MLSEQGLSNQADTATTPLAALLRQYRKRARLTQNELAGLSTVSLRTIRNLEAGRGSNPRPDTVRLLADGLRLTAASLAALNLAVGDGSRGAALTAAVGKAPELSHEAGREPVGRDREIRCVLDALHSGTSRIITIGGFGGAGKSLLALAVARAAQQRHQTPWLWLRSQGAAGTRVFASASPAGRPLEEQFAAWAGELLRGSDSAAEELADLVARRPFLLIIDGAGEESAALETALSELLRRCPGLAVIETTRQPLGRVGRHLFPLKPLAMPARPEPGGPAARATVHQHAAPQLLLRHIRATQADFELTEQNAGPLLEVCHALDGLPRALEAAASWFAFATPRQIAEIAETDPYALATPPGEDSTDSWVYCALADAIDCLPRRRGALLEELAHGSLIWTLDQVLDRSPVGAAELVESLRSFLALGLIRPVGEGDGPRSYSVLSLARYFLC